MPLRATLLEALLNGNGPANNASARAVWTQARLRDVSAQLASGGHQHGVPHGDVASTHAPRFTAMRSQPWPAPSAASHVGVSTASSAASGARGKRRTEAPAERSEVSVPSAICFVMVMVMVIFSALVRSHQSTSPVASASALDAPFQNSDTR